MSILKRLREDYSSLFETLNKVNYKAYGSHLKYEESRIAWCDELKIGLRIHQYIQDDIFDSFLSAQISNEINKKHILLNYQLIERSIWVLENEKLTAHDWYKKALLLKNLTVETLNVEKGIVLDLIENTYDEQEQQKIGWDYTQTKLDIFSQWLCI